MPRPPRPTKAQRPALTPARLHFALTGCYWGGDASEGTHSGFDFSCFMEAIDISQRRLDRLRLLWVAHGPALQAQEARPSFAETVLSGGTPPWPDTPWRCASHPDRRPGQARTGERA